jgi:hypothetical protein
MRTLFLDGVLIIAAGLLSAADVTITWDQWPYGVRNIGAYSKWWMSPDGSSITVPAFNADDTIWDMTDVGGGTVSRDAQSWVMNKSSAQGTPPSYCTFAEKQIQGGQTSWGYEGMDTTGTQQYMWLYGFYAQGSQITYDSPYQQVYQFPMQVGDQWQTTWSWDYLGADYVYENRDNYVVAQGWVKVQADTSQYYPCLVIRTYSTSTDDLGYINEIRVIHEWVVPDMGRVGGSVCTIQSINGVTSPSFTTAEHIFRMKEFHSIFDNTPPAFSGTTQIPSGYNLGPFVVSASVVDSCSVDSVLIVYRLNTGADQTVAADSFHGSEYYMTIPAAAMNTFIRYKVRAVDGSPNHNAAMDPASGYYSFNVIDVSGVASASVFFKYGSAAWDSLAADSSSGAPWFFHLPHVGSPMSIRYYLKATDNSQSHNVATDPANAPSSYYVFFCNAAVEEAGAGARPAVLRVASVNPAEVSFNLPASGRLTVVIYDIKGSAVATLNSGSQTAGEHRFAIPYSLANGTYVLRAALDDQEFRRSFVVSR